VKKIGNKYKFVYPNYGTPNGYPDYTAHSGQVVTVLPPHPGMEGLNRVEAADGWQGNVRDDELNPLYPRKGNIVRLNNPKHVNQLFRVESVGKNYVAVTRLGDNAYMNNALRHWL
jgi:hypothetical protein